MEHRIAEYGVEYMLYVDLFEPNGQNFEESDVPTAASNDMKISKDGGPENNPTNNAVDEGRHISLTLTSTEMQAKEVIVTFQDQSDPKVYMDKAVVIQTVNHASALIPNLWADVQEWLGTAPLALVSQRPQVDVRAKGDSTLGLTTQEKTDVNAEADAALDTAVPATPAADSVNERLKRLEEDVTPTRAANLDNLDAAVSTRAAPGAAMDLVVDALDALSQADAAVNEVRDAIMAAIIEGTVTLKQSLQLSNAAAASKLSGAATTTVNIRDLADTKDRISATVDADGNRSAVTRVFD